MAYGGHCYWTYAVCDVIFTFASLLTHVYSGTPEQRHRSSERIEGNGNWQRQKIITNYVCFCLSTTLTSKTIAGIIENHSEFSACPNSCNKFVFSRFWQIMELTMILSWKSTFAPVVPILQRAEGPMPRLCPVATGLAPQTLLQVPQIELWNTTNQWSFGKFWNDKPPCWRPSGDDSAPAMSPFPTSLCTLFYTHSLYLYYVSL